MDVIQPLIGWEKCLFQEWLAVIPEGFWLLLVEIGCKKQIMHHKPPNNCFEC